MAAERVHAQRDPALFVFGAVVPNSQGPLVFERCSCIGEVDSIFTPVRLRFLQVSLEAHKVSICTIVHIKKKLDYTEIGNFKGNQFS